MTILKYSEMPFTRFRPGGERRLGYTDHLMMVVVDFTDGPQSQPDPLHSHPHEQVSYVVEGEINFIMGDEKMRLSPGDMFLVPSGAPHTIQLLTPPRPVDRLLHPYTGGLSQVRAAVNVMTTCISLPYKDTNSVAPNRKSSGRQLAAPAIV